MAGESKDVTIRVTTSAFPWADPATIERFRGIVESAMNTPGVWGEPVSNVQTTPQKDGVMHVKIRG